MDVPAGLGERGIALWQSMSGSDVVRNALVLEAARLADRLDELDNIIQGKGVLNLMQFRVLNREIEDDGSLNINVEVKFQTPLAEARQQAIAFATILSKLAPADAAAKPAAVPTPANVTPLDRLKARGLKKA
ncbi:terminase small subunit [Arthrobacter phage Zucker]|nr:terminase small subunit [Arthrobacter phage Zucker]